MEDVLMNYGAIAKNAALFFTKNSTTILTGTAVVGVASTTIFAVKGTVEAVRVLALYQELLDQLHPKGHPGRQMQKSRAAKHVWKCYIPTTVSASLTIAAIIGLNTIGNRKNAMLMAAYTLTERAYSDYKDEVVNMLGAKKADEVIDAVAKRRMDDNPVVMNEVIITGLGETLFHDSISGRYFKNDIQTIRAAENDLNYSLIHGDDKSLSDFYSAIGLEPTSFGDTVGWNYTKLMELHFSSHLAPNGTPAVSIEYRQMPVPWYYKVNA